MPCEVVIVGAGIAGLSCALALQEANITCLLLEATDRPGGRVKTDIHKGFLLDHGFQVYLTAYETAGKTLNLEALNLNHFHPGAYLRLNGECHLISDPIRRPQDLLQALKTPLGTLKDKLLIATLKQRLLQTKTETLWNMPEQSTLNYLKAYGFSDTMIQHFFKPFFGGIFLERELQTSCRLFAFVFKMFSQGFAAIPASGMQEISMQLAERLSAQSLRTQTRVSKIEGQTLFLASGETLTSPVIVLATNPKQVSHLLSDPPFVSMNQVSCLYYAAPQSPLADKFILLNGDEQGPINHLCVLSDIAPHYAPAGQALISITVFDETSTMQTDVEHQLFDWFGTVVQQWKHLKTLTIPQGLPAYLPNQVKPYMCIREGLYLAGDYMTFPAIEGAIISGQQVAKQIIQENARPTT